MVFSTKATYANGDPHVNYAFRWGTVTAVVADLVTVTLDSVSGVVPDPGYTAGLAVRVSVGHNYDPPIGPEPPPPPYFDADIISAGINPSTLQYDITFRQPSAIFSMPLPPPAPPTPKMTATVNLWFQQSLYLFEDNVVEVALEQSGLRPQAGGIFFAGPYWDGPIRGFNNGAKYPWLLQSGIIRDNHVRKVGGVLDPGPDVSSAIGFDSCRNLIVEGNVFPIINASFPYDPPFGPQYVFVYTDSLNVKAFNNQAPTGKLQQFYNDARWLNNNDYFLDEI